MIIAFAHLLIVVTIATRYLTLLARSKSQAEELSGVTSDWIIHRIIAIGLVRIIERVQE